MKMTFLWIHVVSSNLLISSPVSIFFAIKWQKVKTLKGHFGKKFLIFMLYSQFFSGLLSYFLPWRSTKNIEEKKEEQSYFPKKWMVLFEKNPIKMGNSNSPRKLSVLFSFYLRKIPFKWYLKFSCTFQVWQKAKSPLREIHVCKVIPIAM